MKKIKVCHLTTAHSSHDIRILKKECVSLANNGFDVTLIAPNCKEEVIEGVNIQSLNIKVTGRFSRFFKVAKKLYEKALVLNADIYHFHDPDFMFYGVKLIRKNKKVIYDIHEDYPLNILEKHWIPKILRPLVSFIYSEIEKYSIKKYTALISVTPQIISRIKKTNPNTFLVTNYPILKKDFEDFNIDLNSKKFIFAGVVEPLRMIHVLVEAMDMIPNEASFVLAGDGTSEYFEELAKLTSWNKVDYKGRIPFEDVISYYKKSLFGVVIEDYNLINYNDEGSLGVTKLFEYMMLGLPFIATDFTLHKEIIDKHQCAITVNPRDKDEVIKALNYMYNNPNEIKKMGERGRKAVKEIYNWNTQEKELLRLYTSL